MTPLRITVLVLLMALIMPMTLYASEAVLLDEITIHGQEINNNQEVLTIREVRESPARDIGEALNRLPGLNSVRKGAIANDVVLRGLQRDNINVLMDGIRVQGGCPSRMDPPAFHFDFAEVASIEVVKGPYDLTHAGSMGGMVNAISKTPHPGPGFSAVLTFGSYEQFNASATASLANQESDILIGYANKSSLPPKAGNGKRITEIYPATSPNRYRAETVDSDAYRIDTVWLKAGHQLTGKTRTELSLAHQNAEHVLYPALLMDAEHDRTGRVNWKTTVDQPTEFLQQARLQVYWTDVDHLMHDRFRESSRPSMMVSRDYMMETDANTTTVGASLSGDVNLGEGRLRGGIDGFYRNWDAVNRSAMFMSYTAQPMIPDVDHDQVGLFAEYQRPITSGLTLETGLRLDYADSEANDLDSTRLGSLYQPYFDTTLSHSNDFFEPSANLQLTWEPADAIELFFGLASASRMPDAQELYIGLQRIPTMMNPGASNWLGNPSLDPPRNNQADVGLIFRGERFFLSGTAFFSRIDDYINIVTLADPDGPDAGTLPGAKSYDNVDAQLWGGEIAGQLSLPWDLYLSGNLAYTRGENRETNKPLAEMPPLSGAFAVRYDNGSWFVELEEEFADRQDRVDQALNEAETAGWGVTHLKAGANIDRWSVFAGVNNLFDKYYFSHLSYQRDPFRTGVKVPETGSFMYLTLMYEY